MSQFKAAAQLNNDGINALLNRDLTTAIEFMGKAIKLMREEIANNFDASTTIASATTSNRVKLQKRQTTETVEIPIMETSETIVFNQAIRIPIDDTTIEEKMNDVDMNIYTSAVVFNYALVHHFKASSGDASCSMDKVEKLYSTVVKLLKGEERSMLTLHTALIVKLACINNLSQIRYSRGDYENAREGCKQVAKFVQSSLNQEIFEEPKVQGLLMHVLLLKEPVAASAA